MNFKSWDILLLVDKQAIASNCMYITGEIINQNEIFQHCNISVDSLWSAQHLND